MAAIRALQHAPIFDITSLDQINIFRVKDEGVPEKRFAALAAKLSKAGEAASHALAE